MAFVDRIGIFAISVIISVYVRTDPGCSASFKLFFITLWLSLLDWLKLTTCSGGYRAIDQD